MPNYGETYLRVIAFSLGLTVFFSALPIALKWLLIGKWKQEAIPIWSLRYFRFWAMKGLIRSAPMAQFGGPIYNLYLRLLGAKIGANTVILSKITPVCTDLISIGDNTILSKDSIILGYKAQSNYIHIGPIHIGSNAFVGEAAVLDINTTMEDDTQLGHASSLHDGQRIPQGKHYHGCPGRETTANYCAIEPRTCTPLRRWSYALVPLIAGFALMPIAVLAIYAVFPVFYEFIGGASVLYEAPGQTLLPLSVQLLLLTFAAFFSGVALGLLSIGVVPRLLNLFLQKDRTYVLYGVHYFVHQMISGLSNSVFYNRLFGDSSAIVHYSRWVGYNLNKVVQTGSNFGMDQRHDNPFLCDIGSGTMVSGGLKMVNETMSSSSFKLGMVKIGENNYLGNYIHYPADAKVGANCLLGTKVLMPIDGPVRENVGLLGAPCFEIPRAVDRDKQMSKMDDDAKRKRLRGKNRYNLVTAILFLLNMWFLSFATSICALVAILYYPRFGMGSIVAATAFASVFAIFWTWLVERAALGFGKLTPKVVLVLDGYYWYHERHWKLSGLWFLIPILAGTPFKNILSRVQGVRLGKRVFDDGYNFNEYSLIEVGDYANLNAEGLIQAHTLEEAVFKSDYVKIGAGCTLGCATNIHYGVTMGDYVVLDPGSFVMKGEIADTDTTWRGNPARAVGDTVVGSTQRVTSEAFAPAKVA